MNDDFLISKKLSIRDFFDDKGRVVAYAYSHIGFPFDLGFIDLPYGMGNFNNLLKEMLFFNLQRLGDCRNKRSLFFVDF